MEKETRALTLTDLKNVFNRAIELEEHYIGVRIIYPEMIKPKIMIYSNEDFETILKAFVDTFNYDLSLDNDEGIKITGFMYGVDFAEIQDMLVY